MKKNRKISGLLWALLFACGASWGSAHAAGLGRLTVQSALGQPLSAEIDLLSVTKDDLADIKVQLASPDAFRQARIDRQEVLANLRFTIDQRANGQPIIRITSTASVPDPFLDMLIELSWSSGRLVREYTLLLDPPASAKPVEPVRPLLAEVKPVTQAVTLAEIAAPAPAKMDAPVPKPRPPEPVAEMRKVYGPVRSGETLRAIAVKLRKPDISLDQMLVGLYQANKNAFQNNNMNSLNRSAVLTIPSLDVLRATQQEEAARSVLAHASEWGAYRRKLSEMAREVAPVAAEEKSAGKIVPKREVTPPPAPATSKDVLKLSQGEPGKLDKRTQDKSQDKLHAMEEELAAKARALQDAQDRVGQLERTVRDMQKLLAMKAQDAPAAAPPEPVVEATVPAVTPPAPAPVVKPAPAPLVKPAPVFLPSVAKQPAVVSSSWYSSLTSNPIYLGGGVAAILLAVLLWMMVSANRRRKHLTKFEDSVMTGGEFKNNDVFKAPAGETEANAEGSMLLTDFSRLGMNPIDNHEVDPIAEAEVYMAYGRDAQAEEILREALAKDPTRHEIALKLLELYAARKDLNSFEVTASELYAGLAGQNTPVWQRAAEMGRSIDPENPLYQAASNVNTSVAAKSVVAAAVASKAAAVPAAQAVAREAVELGDLEELASMDGWDAAPEPPDNSLEFTSTPAPEVAKQVPAAPVPESFDGNLMEFDGGFSKPKPDTPPEAEMEFDLPEPEPVMQTAEAEPMGLDLDAAGDFDLNADLSASFDSAEMPELPVEPEVELPSLSPPALPDLPEPEPEAAFDFELPEPEPSSAASLDELADFGLPEEVQATEVEEEVTPVFDLSGIDLDLDLDELPETKAQEPGQQEPEQPEPEQPEPSVDVDDLFAAFDDEINVTEADEFPLTPPVTSPQLEESQPVPEPEAPIVPELDPELHEEVNTKLDLARAYLEMGDREGAREILQEVLGEGDKQQKAEANHLLADVS